MYCHPDGPLPVDSQWNLFPRLPVVQSGLRGEHPGCNVILWSGTECMLLKQKI